MNFIRIKHLKEGLDAADFNEKEKALLAFARKANREPLRIADDEFSALHRAEAVRLSEDSARTKNWKCWSVIIIITVMISKSNFPPDKTCFIERKESNEKVQSPWKEKGDIQISNRER